MRTLPGFLRPNAPVVKPPCGEAMRSRIVCIGMGVPEPGVPEMIRGPDSLGVTTIPGGRLGTRYVTLGCAIIDGVSRKLPPACVTTPDDTAVAARSTGWLAEGVTCGDGRARLRRKRQGSTTPLIFYNFYKKLLSV